MNKTYSITIPAERKRGQHLDAETRGAIQRLIKLDLSNRAIAREVDCSPSLLWKGELPLALLELPEALSRKQRGKPVFVNA